MLKERNRNIFSSSILDLYRGVFCSGGRDEKNCFAILSIYIPRDDHTVGDFMLMNAILNFFLINIRCKKKLQIIKTVLNCTTT